jgi:hypothetical protein
VAPVGAQLGLRAEQPRTPHDQALTGAEDRLGDLRLAVFGVVVKRLPVGLVDRGDRGLEVLLLAHADRAGPAGPGTGRQDRVIATPSRVAEAGALLVIAMNFTDKRININNQTSITGCGPGRPRTLKAVGQHAGRTCPNVNARKNVPTVDGAATRCPSTAAVCPDRRMSQSSMQSAPNAIAETIVITLRPAFAPPGRSARRTV